MTTSRADCFFFVSCSRLPLVPFYCKTSVLPGHAGSSNSLSFQLSESPPASTESDPIAALNDPTNRPKLPFHRPTLSLFLAPDTHVSRHLGDFESE